MLCIPKQGEVNALEYYLRLDHYSLSEKRMELECEVNQQVDEIAGLRREMMQWVYIYILLEIILHTIL